MTIYKIKGYQSGSSKYYKVSKKGWFIWIQIGTESTEHEALNLIQFDSQITIVKVKEKIKRLGTW